MSADNNKKLLSVASLKVWPLSFGLASFPAMSWQNTKIGNAQGHGDLCSDMRKILWRGRKTEPSCDSVVCVC